MEEKGWGGGILQQGSGGFSLAWVRCRFEFYLSAILGFLNFVRFLALFLFPSFPELYLTSPYSEFRVYLSDFA